MTMGAGFVMEINVEATFLRQVGVSRSHCAPRRGHSAAGVNRAGGITEAIKICAMAEAEGLPVVPHSNEAHNLHVIFSRSAHVCPVVEYFPNVEPDTGNELFWKIYSGLPSVKDGELSLGEAPGLGIALREDVVQKLQCGKTALSAMHE